MCCPSGAPYRCAKTSQCYGTAEAANQACGSMGTCLACGAASEDDVYLQPGPYLQLAYNAKGHDAKQCSAPWGPTCRAAAACCSSLAGSLAQQCANALVSTQGNETACPTITKQQCPSYGPQCAAYKACCETLGAEALRDACLAAARNYASAGNESQCQAESKQKCPPGGG